NNQYLGMVRQWQQLFHGNRLSSVDLSMQPDFVKLADAYHCVGWRIDKPEDVGPAIARALEVKDGPCILDFWVAREENVLPMVPAGGSIDQMVID
ncbi:MAG TPA: thiamine pyrophosphate-dependent enzyme, partial [Armatimonadota bacterium]|nr:thiamine pyrophosphate-dependent enzyme [Armatimonadota bacterium]